ncbi:MAG: CPBP family glutamic-type intramembrane protease [Methylococcaceae bacterium]|nr:CPBP family glutamic-type intramembrane protease [Methylococcaceae bacterium]
MKNAEYSRKTADSNPRLLSGRAGLAAYDLLMVAALWFFGLWALPRFMGADWFGFAYAAWVVAGGAYVSVISWRLHADPPQFHGVSPSWRTGFLRLDNLAPSCRPIALFTLISTLLILAWVILGMGRDRFHIDWRAFLGQFLFYSLFALAQGWLYFEFYAVRFRRLKAYGSSRLLTSLLTACVFSLFHLPNAPIMALGFMAALVWAWVYWEYPNLLPIAVSQAWLATMLHKFIGMNFRIGYFYDHTDQYFLRDLWPAFEAYLRTLW